jgi:hypothetical protein
MVSRGSAVASSGRPSLAMNGPSRCPSCIPPQPRVVLKFISVQVQPEKSPGINIARLTDLFNELVGRVDLVRHHAFDSGDDGGAYFNFTFGTEHPGELWCTMFELIYEAPEHKVHMACASMAMCSGEFGWDTYVQLFHWDPLVPIASAAELQQSI